MTDVDELPFTLKPFQAEDEQWLKTHTKGGLLYDRGLGKTVVPTMRNINAGVGTHFVGGPKNSMKTWMRHTQEWYQHFYPNYDIDIFFINGKPEERRKIYAELLHSERTRQHRLFCTSYGSLLRDHELLTPKHTRNIDQYDWDEAHRMRNRKSKLYSAILRLCKHHAYFNFLTGTPISRGPQEYWTYLHCINPKLFSSYWAFVRTFCDVFDGMWGPEIVGLRNQEQFFWTIKQYFRIREKTDPEIATQLPPKTRQAIWVDLDDQQYRHYKELGLNNLSITDNGQLILAENSMEQVIRFRQLLCCPKILDPSLGLGSAITDYLERMEEGDDRERFNVVFVPFRKAMPYIGEALQKLKIPVQYLYGGLHPDDQDQRIQSWRNTGGAILCTIPYAESFELTPATESYFIGYEWDPNQNVQAEDRLHRLYGTPAPVTAYYYRYMDTVDDDMCHVVNWKQGIITTINRGAHA